MRLYGVSLEQAQATDDERLRAVLDESAGFFGEMGHMARVRPALEGYIGRREEKGVPQTALELLDPMRMLLRANIDADDPPAVDSACQRIVEILEAHPEVEAEASVAALAEVHESYIRYGRLDVAEDLHRRFASILARHDEKTAALGTLYDQMARMHLGPRGDLFKAEWHWKDALAVQEQVFGPVSPAVAETLENLASIQAALGHEEDQQASLLRVLAIREQLGAPGSPDTTRALLSLASHYRARDDEAAAQRYADRAWRSCEAGGGSPEDLLQGCGAFAP